MNKLIVILFFGILFFAVISCEENNDNEAILVNSDEVCGCDSISTDTISELEPLTGTITIKVPLIPQDTLYNYKYWIGYNFAQENDCIDCVQSYIVCNEDFINGELKEELSSGETVEVIFSGYVKELCFGVWTVGFYRYNSIVLTKIEKRE